MHNRIFPKSVILNTSEHRSTIKALLVGALQQELQVTSRQILGGLPQSLATLRLNLLCRFKPERRWRRSAISWCSKAWPAHESCTMSKMVVSCASPHRNNMLLLHIRADTVCTPNSFEPRQRKLMSETFPTCCMRRHRFPARKTQLKSSTLTRSSHV